MFGRSTRSSTSRQTSGRSEAPSWFSNTNRMSGCAADSRRRLSQSVSRSLRRVPARTFSRPKNRRSSVTPKTRAILDLPIDRCERPLDVGRGVKEIAPSARHGVDADAERGDFLLDRFHAARRPRGCGGDSGRCRAARAAKTLERRQQRLGLVGGRRGEQTRRHLSGFTTKVFIFVRFVVNSSSHTGSNSNDFWYAEWTVSGMPQYLNSACRPTYRRFGIFLPRSTYAR